MTRTMPTTRRRRGTGCVEALPDGRFCGRLPRDGGRLEPCATYEEAERVLEAALQAIAAGAVKVGDDTLVGFGLAVLDARERAGLRGVATERSRWRTHVEPFFRGRLLTSIRRSDVIAWRDEMLTKKAAKGRGYQKAPTRPLARTTVNNTLNFERAVFAAALDRDLVRANPARDVRLPRGAGRTHDPWTYLLPGEQQALLTCAAIPEDRRLLIAFALGTGLRQGEQWHLELGDVQAGKVVVRYGAKGKATKSGKIRRVPLLPIARDALARQLELLARAPNPHGLAWPTPTGARRQKGEPAWWKDALAAAGVVAEKRHDRRPVRWHDLRHSSASSLIAGWWGRRWVLEEVRELLGHSSITVTQRYAHLAESALDQAAGGTSGVNSTPWGCLDPKKLSHLGDLNPRPTVYETVAFIPDPEGLQAVWGDLVGLALRAVAARRALAAGAAGARGLVDEALRAVEEAGGRAALAIAGQGRIEGARVTPMTPITAVGGRRFAGSCTAPISTTTSRRRP